MAEPVPEYGSRAALPLYLKVARALREDLARHRIAPGSRLPSERHLALRHHVNRQTVRSALQLLREERLVVTDRRGTFAAAHEPDAQAPVPLRRTFPGGHRAADALVRATLSWEAPPAALAGRLALAAEEPTLVHRHVVLGPGDACLQRSVSWFSRPALAEIPQLGRYRRSAERHRQPDLRLLYHWTHQAGLRTTHRESVGVPAGPGAPEAEHGPGRPGRPDGGAPRLTVHRVVSDQHGHTLEVTEIDLVARADAWTCEFAD
ncbi:GntR family transcriptional regulator [Streptomyces sp. NPDC053493]|uniref:GntR family transcriptional regulator n=1 Tax=Streptomyces sp. NPDC053493 TaxID=3365705 RepID=UPI0037D30093